MQLYFLKRVWKKLWEFYVRSASNMPKHARGYKSRTNGPITLRFHQVNSATKLTLYPQNHQFLQTHDVKVAMWCYYVSWNPPLVILNLWNILYIQQMRKGLKINCKWHRIRWTRRHVTVTSRTPQPSSEVSMKFRKSVNILRRCR